MTKEGTALGGGDKESRKGALVKELGGRLHDEWRAPRKKEDGTYEPRMKAMYITEAGKEKWVDEAKLPEGASAVTKQDIANTPFGELLPHWQFENAAAAEVAVGEVLAAQESGTELNDEFIEKASATVHERWLERNQWVLDPNYGNPDQAKPYADLSEAEKEKDRAQIRKAIEVCSAR